jgi:hypothetical protein
MIKSTTINRQGVEWILEQPIEVQLSIVANHLDICKAVINSLLQTAVQQQAGPATAASDLLKATTAAGVSIRVVCSLVIRSCR